MDWVYRQGSLCQTLSNASEMSKKASLLLDISIRGLSSNNFYFHVFCGKQEWPERIPQWHGMNIIFLNILSNYCQQSYKIIAF